MYQDVGLVRNILTPSLCFISTVIDFGPASFLLVHLISHVMICVARFTVFMSTFIYILGDATRTSRCHDGVHSSHMEGDRPQIKYNLSKMDLPACERVDIIMDDNATLCINNIYFIFYPFGDGNRMSW